MLNDLLDKIPALWNKDYVTEKFDSNQQEYAIVTRYSNQDILSQLVYAVENKVDFILSDILPHEFPENLFFEEFNYLSRKLLFLKQVRKLDEPITIKDRTCVILDRSNNADYNRILTILEKKNMVDIIDYSENRNLIQIASEALMYKKILYLHEDIYFSYFLFFNKKNTCDLFVTNNNPLWYLYFKGLYILPKQVNLEGISLRHFSKILLENNKELNLPVPEFNKEFSEFSLCKKFYITVNFEKLERKYSKALIISALSLVDWDNSILQPPVVQDLLELLRGKLRTKYNITFRNDISYFYTKVNLINYIPMLLKNERNKTQDIATNICSFFIESFLLSKQKENIYKDQLFKILNSSIKCNFKASTLEEYFNSLALGEEITFFDQLIKTSSGHYFRFLISSSIISKKKKDLEMYLDSIVKFDYIGTENVIRILLLITSKTHLLEIKKSANFCEIKKAFSSYLYQFRDHIDKENSLDSLLIKLLFEFIEFPMDLSNLPTNQAIFLILYKSIESNRNVVSYLDLDSNLDSFIINSSTKKLLSSFATSDKNDTNYRWHLLINLISHTQNKSLTTDILCNCRELFDYDKNVESTLEQFGFNCLL